MGICLKCTQHLGGKGHYGLHLQCFSEWFRVPAGTIFTNFVRRDSVSIGDSLIEGARNTSFFHGRFKKYSATLANRGFILKMHQPDAPEFPAVEYLCNQIAVMLKIPVANFYIINLAGELVFVTENFIYGSKTPIDLQHIHHFRTGSKHNCKDLIELIKSKTGKPYFVKVLINTILFDALIGNHDRHGRNLAFVVTAGDLVLSSIYGNVSALSLESGDILQCDFNPLGCIYTQHSKEPGMLEYVSELIDLGYKQEVGVFINQLDQATVSGITDLIYRSFCSSLMMNALNKLITKRYKELQDAWKAQA